MSRVKLYLMDKRVKRAFGAVKDDINHNHDFAQRNVKVAERTYKKNNRKLREAFTAVKGDFGKTQGRSKKAFGKVKRDINKINSEFDRRNYRLLVKKVEANDKLVQNELAQLREENRLLEKTLRKILDLETEFKAFHKLQDEVTKFKQDYKNEVRTIKETHKQDLKEVTTDLKTNYGKKVKIELLHDKTEGEIKILKERLKELKKTSATVEQLKMVDAKIPKHNQKIKKNFQKVKSRFDSMEDNFVELDDVKAQFLTRETLREALDKEFKVVNKRIDKLTKADNKATRKEVEKTASGLHNKTNSLQKELDSLGDQITKMKKDLKNFSGRKEVEKLTSNLVPANKHNQVEQQLAEVMVQLRSMEAENKAQMKVKKQLEKLSSDLHDKLNALQNELDTVGSDIAAVKNTRSAFVKEDQLAKVSRDFVSFDDHYRLQGDLEKMRMMLSDVQYSEKDIKKLRSNVDNIITALVPKKDHEKEIQNVHKKISSLKEDLDEMTQEFVKTKQYDKISDEVAHMKDILKETAKVSEKDLKELKKSLNEINADLVSKKEHAKELENVHKKIASLKEDLDETQKK